MTSCLMRAVAYLLGLPWVGNSHGDLYTHGNLHMDFHMRIHMTGPEEAKLKWYVKNSKEGAPKI